MAAAWYTSDKRFMVDVQILLKDDAEHGLSSADPSQRKGRPSGFVPRAAR